MKIRDISVVEGDNRSEFLTSLKQYIKEGYRPHGSLQVTRYQLNFHSYFQLMIKYEEIDSESA